MNWQPIESAPKGEHVLIYCVDCGVGTVTEGRLDPVYGHWDPAWLDVHGCGCCGGSRPTPTHWMPLPEPPEDA